MTTSMLSRFLVLPLDHIHRKRAIGYQKEYRIGVCQESES